MDAEDVLFLLYTSRHDRQAEGHLPHDGRLPARRQVTHQLVFDIRADDVYWCTADCGWVTGHSYIVYGPLRTTPPASCTRARPSTRPGPALGDHGAPRGHDLLHGADRDPRAS